MNKQKSTQIFAGLLESMVEQLKQITGYYIGSLAMRYLGVPLIAGRLSYKDCSNIVDKIKQRLIGWKTKPLSFARRLSLLKSILQSCYIYWAEVFGLPGRVRKQVESIFAKFLWGGPNLTKKIS